MQATGQLLKVGNRSSRALLSFFLILICSITLALPIVNSGGVFPVKFKITDPSCGGTITLDDEGILHNGESLGVPLGTYSIHFTATPGAIFQKWTSSGGVTVALTNSQSTSVTVFGSGTLGVDQTCPTIIETTTTPTTTSYRSTEFFTVTYMSTFTYQSTFTTVLNSPPAVTSITYSPTLSVTTTSYQTLVTSTVYSTVTAACNPTTVTITATTISVTTTTVT